MIQTVSIIWAKNIFFTFVVHRILIFFHSWLLCIAERIKASFAQLCSCQISGRIHLRNIEQPFFLNKEKLEILQRGRSVKFFFDTTVTASRMKKKVEPKKN